MLPPLRLGVPPLRKLIGLERDGSRAEGASGHVTERLHSFGPGDPYTLLSAYPL